VSHEIVRQHGGELSVDSHPGVGSRLRWCCRWSNCPLPRRNSHECFDLVVDDERAIQDTLAWCLRDDGHGVRTAGSGEEAMAIMADQGFDLIISDIIMPGLSGVDCCAKAHALQPQTLFRPDHRLRTVETAVEALREGRSDYVVKPFKFDELRLRVRRLLEQRAVTQESALFRRAVESAVPDRSLLGESAAMHAVRTQVAKTGPAVSNVLITARAVPARSWLPAPFTRQSPARTSVRSHQLWSHPRGAPRKPAVRARQGRFHQRGASEPRVFIAADHGTVFLDEIGEMPVHLQVKLLRAIEEKQVWAVGSTNPSGSISASSRAPTGTSPRKSRLGDPR